MADAVKILSMQLVDRELDSGNRMLAIFDVGLSHVEIRRCVLMTNPRGFSEISPPRTRTETRPGVISFVGAAFPIVQAACAVYRAMGGPLVFKFEKKSGRPGVSGATSNYPPDAMRK